MNTAPQTTRPAARPEVAEPAIEVTGLTKVFARNEERAITLKEEMLGALARQVRTDLVVALEDVSLTVKPGEVVGVIGANGSGKSTLLKAVAGILEPTAGRVRTRGRVLGLIELGAGFHEDLTGEQNIRLQAAIYGMDPHEIEPLIDPILEFAELDDFRDMEVRHYSSGMYMRLGFAIAVHIPRDVLLVDEVLAVGDQTFQERCLRELTRVREQGTSLLFVTHFLEQAERICDRIVWLERGLVRRDGPARAVLADFQHDVLVTRHPRPTAPVTLEVFARGVPGRFGSGEVLIDHVRILDARGLPSSYFLRGDPIAFEVSYVARPTIDQVDCTILLRAQEGSLIATWKAQEEAGLSRPATDGLGRFRLDLPEPRLLPGRYDVIVALSPPGHPNPNHYDFLYKLVAITVGVDERWDTTGFVELKAGARALPDLGGPADADADGPKRE